jgi:hypothetical protein
MKRFIFKKVIVFLIIGLLFFTTYSVSSFPENKVYYEVLCEYKNNSKMMISNGLADSIELIDQKNSADHIDATSGIFLHGGWCLAQGFVPTQKILSKVSLVIGKNGFPPSNIELTVHIRKNSLNGDNIASQTVNADDLTSSIVDFILPDISIIPGDKYYIICKADKSTAPDHAYYWVFTFNNKYKSGEAWHSENCYVYNEVDDLLEYTGYDYCFTTYWKDYGPDLPDIEGQSVGKVAERYDYTFSTTDPEGHDVRYYIDWGDGKTFNWIGPYSSGEKVTKSHQWALEDEYIISVKAKDIYNVESDLAEMTVSMTKTKNPMTYNNPPEIISTDYNTTYNDLIIVGRDSDDDKIRYGVDWDNDRIEVDYWTSYRVSGEKVFIRCTEAMGRATVLAEDEHGSRSDWISVITKNKCYKSPFLKFLENHPQIFPILQRILKLTI